MGSVLPSSSLYSHPERLLEDHLRGTASLIDKFVEEKVNDQNIKELARIIALSHDIGKATAYFQRYLFNGGASKRQREARHGLFSALCAYYLAKEFLSKKGIEDWHLPFFAYIVVKRHHGNLQDIIDEAIFDDKDKELLSLQLTSIDDNNFNILAKHIFNYGLPLELSKNLIKEWIEDFSSESRAIKRKLRKGIDGISSYFLLNFLYSLLIDADKSDVVVQQENIFKRDSEIIKPYLVDNYKKTKQFRESPVNRLREEAYQEVSDKEINLNQKIYSLNLPTGLGKTFSSFSFALKLREKIKNETKNLTFPRIIYALPFLSVIEQNADEFGKILKANGIILNTSVLLKHHHLSEVFYKTSEEEMETDAAKILMEGWNSEIIITTFVQFFHTLISNRNRSIRKFHRLMDSIIILDEVQAIPCKYWLLMKTTLEELTQKFNSYIIFVTATEPLIFSREDTVPLVVKDKYFSALSRVIVQPVLENSMTLEELLIFMDFTENKRYLFVFNTIGSAKNFYELVRRRESDVVFLSTYVIPKERLKRVDEIKNGRYKIAVTTQLVEAGVDIDFDVVIRDLAPLDSINQAAGRCNRNGLCTGKVLVVSLQDENKKKFASYIYDSVLLDITKKILAKYKIVQEKEFINLIEEYYHEVSVKKSSDEAKALLDAIARLRYDGEDDTSIADFKLIEEDYYKEDVFVEVDNHARVVWQKYVELKEIKNRFERKKAFDIIKADFYQYVISVSAKTENRPPEVAGFRYVSNNLLEDYYDPATGYKVIGRVPIW